MPEPAPLAYPSDDADDEAAQAYLDAKARDNARERLWRRIDELAGMGNPHYCIFCGKEVRIGTKCCNAYAGTLTYGPDDPLIRDNTFMGRPLFFSSWPWQGDPDAPYVRIR